MSNTQVAPFAAFLRRFELALADSGTPIPAGWTTVSDDGVVSFGNLSGRSASALLRFFEDLVESPSAPGNARRYKVAERSHFGGVQPPLFHYSEDAE